MDFHDPIELHSNLGPVLSVSNADAVAQLYSSILKRSADDGGLNAWVSALNGGVTLAEVRAALINSAEASATIDPLVRLYEAAFGRVPEDAGLEGWATALRSGTSFLEIAEGFTGSAEFAARYPEVANGDLSGFITALYQQTLGRAPEAAGLAGWIGSGLSTAEILIGFSESLEFHNRSEANVTTYLSAVGQGNTPNAVYSLFQLGTSAELTGDVIDGKVAGATIGIDVNGDGIISDDEPTLTTDALGNFSFPDGTPKGNLIATGGTDISTGLAFTGKLEAPSGSTVITPLTTVIKKLTDLDTDATKTDEQKAADAQTQLKELLGLTSIGADITQVDFVTEASEGDVSGTDGLSDLEATQLYAASVQLLNIVAQGAAAITGADGSVGGEAASDAVFAALANALNNQPAGTQVDLTSSTAADNDDTNDANDLLTNVIKDAAGNALTGDALANAQAIADSAAKIVAAANKEVGDVLDVLEALDPLDPNFGDNSINTLVRIVQTQKVVQGEAADELRTAAGSADPDAAADGLADTISSEDGSGFNDDSIITSQNVGDVTGDGSDDDGNAGSDNPDDGGVIDPDGGTGTGGGGGGAPDTTAPAITSATDFVVAENATTVATLTADETATFEIVGGDDAAQFEITASGELSFIAAPDFESASDADTDNTYEVQVQATDGSGNSSSASLDVVVANAVEAGQTIQEAIDAASPGDTIHLEARTYTLTSTLNLNKGVAIVGAGEGQTILDGSDLDGYGISMTANGSSLSGFTFEGPGVPGASTNDNYGIKVSPLAGPASNRVESITIENVTVQGSLLTEIDLNGVNGAVLRNVTADGQSTGGNGISVTDSANILLENITTTGNLWGSVALYNANRHYDQNTEDITFAGTYNAAEGTKIFAQDSNTAPGADLGTVNFNATGTGNWQVKNSDFRLPAKIDSEQFTFFFASQAEAEAYALGLNAGTTPANDTSVVISPTGEFHVFAGMSIQTAIDAALDGDTITVHDGTYSGTVTIDKDVTLLGVNAINDAPFIVTGDGATISGFALSGGSTLGSNSGVYVKANNVTLTDLVLTGPGEGATGGTFRGILTETAFGQNLTVDNVTASDWATGVYLNPGAVGATVLNSTLTGNFVGLSTDAPDGVTLTDNTLGGTFEDLGIGPVVTSISATGNTFVAGKIGNYDANIVILGSSTINGTTFDQVELGTSGDDTHVGSGGDDIIYPGGGLENTILGSAGNDTIALTGPSGITFDYSGAEFFAGITVTLDTSAGTIAKPGGETDSLTGINTLLPSDESALFFLSSDGDDVFNIDTLPQFLTGIHSSAGDDQISATDGSNARAVYKDLSEGIIYTSNDGPRLSGTVTAASTGTDTLNNIQEIKGTAFADVFTGGTGNEIFTSLGGNDAIDGGSGYDTVRYDRDGVGAVTVDLATTGVATGTYNGDGFSQTLSNIDRVFGSRTGNDDIAGSAANETFRGRGGDDTLEGRGGDDLLRGDDGIDTAVFSGALADYTITDNGGGTYTVADNNLTDGTDTLKDIELLRFDNNGGTAETFNLELGRLLTEFDQSVTPGVIFGTGNANGGFTTSTVDDASHSIELALRGKLRFDANNDPQNIFNSNGDGTYTFENEKALAGFSFDPGAATTPIWSFEWSVNTDLDNNSGNSLNDYIYLLEIDGDPGATTDFGTLAGFDPINVPLADHALGNNTTTDASDVVETDAGAYAAAIDTHNVAQNSWNYEFFNEASDGLHLDQLTSFDPTEEGVYTIRLSAFDGADLVNTVSIDMIVVDIV